MVEVKYTVDQKGNNYKKFRLNSDGNAVVCTNGTNKHYRGQPNVSIRTGPSVFGTEIIFQIEVKELKSEYKSNSAFAEHVEVYLTEQQAKELLTPLLSQLGVNIGQFDAKEWSKSKCTKCGEHLNCPDCKSYDWHKGDLEEANKK